MSYAGTQKVEASSPDLHFALKCWAWSTATREGLQRFKLSPSERLLGGQMVLESFDQCRTVAPVLIPEWCHVMGGTFLDNGKPREAKLRAVLDNLVQLGVVDVNQAQGTFELRPDWTLWRFRGLRCLPQEGSKAATDSLQLRAERLLSEALSENSRTGAMKTGGPVLVRDWPDLFNKARQAVNDPSKIASLLAEFPAEKVAAANCAGGGEIRRNAAAKSAGMQVTAAQGFAAAPESYSHYSQPPIAISLDPNKLRAIAKPAEKSASPSMDEVVLELRSVDLGRELQRSSALAQWEDLAGRKPGYVMGLVEEYRSRSALYARQGRKAIASPVAWISRIARDAGELRRQSNGLRHE